MDSYGEEATGRQDSTMLGMVSGQSTRNETTPFSSDDQKGTIYSRYNGSIVEGYVNNYGAYLQAQGAIPIEARIITKEELKGLGCSEVESSCNVAPS